MIWNRFNGETSFEPSNITGFIHITGDINQLGLDRLDVISRWITLPVGRNHVVHSRGDFFKRRLFLAFAYYFTGSVSPCIFPLHLISLFYTLYVKPFSYGYYHF